MNELDDIMAAQNRSVNPVKEMIDAAERAPKRAQVRDEKTHLAKLVEMRATLALNQSGEPREWFWLVSGNASVMDCWESLKKVDATMLELEALVDAAYTKWMSKEHIRLEEAERLREEAEKAKPAIDYANGHYKPTPVDDCDEHEAAGPVAVTTAGWRDHHERKDRGDWFDPIPKDE